MSSSGVLLFTVLLIGYLYWSLAQPTNLIEIRCRLIPPVTDASLCPHGAFLNVCNKLACVKGPGENCGGNAAGTVLFGQCAHGLRCCNGKCNGCINGNCYREPCHPQKSHGFQHRSDPYMPVRRMDPLYTFFDYYANE
ncbi:neuroparsin-A-like [Anopheles cruzii]|uniref:neuroparsin-A-like n=1 Tax=Anopheles cruzii TaxID=68878 RepID=UPI0022EC7B12|nr:neuroparsin-A-like [Anopheles cruzii]